MKNVIDIVFIGSMESLRAPPGHWKLLREKPLPCFLASLLWPLLQDFLEICLTLSHHLYCLLTHLLKTNRSEVNGYFLKFMTVLGCMIPKTAMANSPSYRWILSRMLFRGWDFTGAAPYAHKEAVCLVCHSLPKALRRVGAWSAQLSSSTWEHKWIKVLVTQVSEAITVVFSS